MSLATTPLAFTDHWYKRDYWQPDTIIAGQYNFESFVFAFLAGGIGAFLYEEVMSRALVNRHRQEPRWLLLLLPVIVITSFFIFTDVFGLNSMYSSFIGLGIVALIMVTLRHELFKVALYGAILITTFAVPFYFIFSFIFPDLGQRWWMIQNLSGITVFGFPIEEILFYPAWGMVAAPLYEFITGFGDRRMPAYNKR